MGTSFKIFPIFSDSNFKFGIKICIRLVIWTKTAWLVLKDQPQRITKTSNHEIYQTKMNKLGQL